MVFSKFLYETGARSNEAQRLEWTDIHKDRNKVTIKASKNGNSGLVSISDDLMKLIFSLSKNQETVFRKRAHNTISSSFRNRMQRLAKFHNNPRFTKIHLHTFRHGKALREYHKTRDVLQVKTILGHKSIRTTMHYVEFYTQIYSNDLPNQFITKIASTKEERCNLINDGWVLVEKDGEDWYFKKPK